MTQDSGLRTQDSGLRTQDSGLRTQDSGLIIRFSPFKDGNLYIALMLEAIRLGGYRLSAEDSLKKAALHCDVFHFNWDVFSWDVLSWGLCRRLWNCFKKIVCIFCIKALGRKIVYTLHDKIPLHKIANRSKLRDFISKFILKHADKIIIHSTESISAAKAILPDVDEAKFVYVPHPNYITAYQDTKTFSNEIRAQHRIILSFIGRIETYKCLDILVRTAKELRAYSDIHFLVCGRGDKTYIDELSAMIDGTDNISAYFRFIENGEIPSLLEISDAVLLPYNTSTSLNSGASYLAFSFGRTVIGTWTGTTKDVDENLVYCYDYTDNAEAHVSRLKEAILKFYADFTQNEGAVREKGRKLREIMLTEHSLEKTAEALRKAYGVIE